MWGALWVTQLQATKQPELPEYARQTIHSCLEAELGSLTGGMRGQASDIQIEAEQIIKMRDRVNRMIAKETGQTVERIVKDTQRNFWMSAEEAKEYGLVSRIINNTSEV